MGRLCDISVAGYILIIMKFKKTAWVHNDAHQGFSTLVLEVHSPALIDLMQPSRCTSDVLREEQEPVRGSGCQGRESETLVCVSGFIQSM